MTKAPRIEITAPIGARAEFLARQYEDVSADPARLSQLLDQLRAHRGHAVVDGWQALLAEKRMVELSAALMVEHYDPAYARSRAAHEPVFSAHVEAETLDADGLARAADEISAAMRAI